MLCLNGIGNHRNWYVANPSLSNVRPDSSGLLPPAK